LPHMHKRASVLCIGASKSAALLEPALYGYAVTIGDDTDAMVSVAQRCCYDAYVASDEISRERLAAIWQAVRGFDRNTPFLMVLTQWLVKHDMVLRYGYDGAVDVADGVMAMRQALEQLLDAARDRALDARAIEAAVLRDALLDQFESHASGVARVGQAMRRADEHRLRALAMAVFEARGGPPSYFSRLWPEMLAEFAGSRANAKRHATDL